MQSFITMWLDRTDNIRAYYFFIQLVVLYFSVIYFAVFYLKTIFSQCLKMLFISYIIPKKQI